jgi:hypothetical protein
MINSTEGWGYPVGNQTKGGDSFTAQFFPIIISKLEQLL